MSQVLPPYGTSFAAFLPVLINRAQCKSLLHFLWAEGGCVCVEVSPRTARCCQKARYLEYQRWVRSFGFRNQSIQFVYQTVLFTYRTLYKCYNLTYFLKDRRKKLIEIYLLLLTFTLSRRKDIQFFKSWLSDGKVEKIKS